MYWVRELIYIIFLSCFLGAQTFSFQDDPVMKIRTQRSQNQGVSEFDLPPVPRSVMEPPPLPLPEVHIKDAVHSLVMPKPINPTKGFTNNKIIHVVRAIKPKFASKHSIEIKEVKVAKKNHSAHIHHVSSCSSKKLQVMRKTIKIPTRKSVVSVSVSKLANHMTKSKTISK